MALILYAFAPLLLVSSVSALISRRRPSAAFALLQGVLGSLAGLLASAICLLPAKRMEFHSLNGMLRLSFGRTAVLALLALYAVSGALCGLALREQPAARPAKRRALASGITLVLLFLLLLLAQAYFWGMKVYPNTSMDEIIFYLNMPLHGTSHGFILSVLHSVLLPAVLGVLPFAVLALLSSGKRGARETVLLGKIRLPLSPLHLPALLVYPLLLCGVAVSLVHLSAMLDIPGYIRSCINASSFIEEHYVAPETVVLTFPEKKRNLITIYLESYETTTQDKASGGALDNNLIPEMTQIALENVSFSRSDLITGAVAAPRCTWTMSALVAQTAGLPLLNINNEGEEADELLPGAVTLGDLLREQGYRLMFMAGSDFTFGGRRAYYRTHGDYEVFDLNTAREEGRIPPEYYESWGFEDVKLYAYAKEKLLELAQSGEPFHFAMLTADTHSPGYRCPLCPTDYQNTGNDSLNYADTLRCSSAQCAEFIAWCQEQDFYENTTIVVAGDHESMQEYFYNNLFGDDHANDSLDRYVYNAFIHSAVEPVQEKNRLFTTLDFFPTTLASIGVSIEGERLGLGTNLFSDRETLSEQCGEDVLNDELQKKSVFYEEQLLFHQDKAR